MAILRSASSTVVHRALRAIASSRTLSGFVTSASRANTDQNTLVKRESNLSTDFKKLVDRKLVKVLKSEIKSKQLSLAESAIPTHFPFTIQDSVSFITLTRELDGEKIDVFVFKPSNDEKIRYLSIIDHGGAGADDSTWTESDSDEEEKSDAYPAPSLSLFVTICKGNRKPLEFSVSASADEIQINSIEVVDSADRCSRSRIYIGDCRHAELQLALREYLKIRGIKKSIVGVLFNYILRKPNDQPILDDINVLKDVENSIKE